MKDIVGTWRLDLGTRRRGQADSSVLPAQAARPSGDLMVLTQKPLLSPERARAARKR